MFLIITESIQNNLSSFFQFLLCVVLPISYLWFLQDWESNNNNNILIRCWALTSEAKFLHVNQIRMLVVSLHTGSYFSKILQSRWNWVGLNSGQGLAAKHLLRLGPLKCWPFGFSNAIFRSIGLITLPELFGMWCFCPYCGCWGSCCTYEKCN